MDKTFGQQVREERERRGWSQQALADAANTTQQSIDRIERDAVRRSRSHIEVASVLDIALPAKFANNAAVSGPANLDANSKLPAYGQAIGGAYGEFMLNGNKIDDILAPPGLLGIRDAYAVYVSGESMEPRYFAGEVLFINPRLPIRRGDFVVAQIAQDEHSAPLAYVKRFVSKQGTLRLEQFNPPEVLEFDSADVVSVHKVVMSGEG
ncbi:S24 family peptidase [Rhizobium rhizogenes]|jgi:SOS-response transcriptional repressor LexA|uniref:S24 family peptidase n=1 Tax=Rhizobium rhizogenes TaxID=359 RepID=UPI001573F0CB|nr:S24 family peptidase [Rhizobium rhizogenes]NTG01848.1 helix-turn-helix transcriptional regulator [Rhizobium rhizogenes]NTG94227.1 helix-turn-helix transcriptional regulator [Rhizobium rhizogenes]